MASGHDHYYAVESMTTDPMPTTVSKQRPTCDDLCIFSDVLEGHLLWNFVDGAVAVTGLGDGFDHTYRRRCLAPAAPALLCASRCVGDSLHASLSSQPPATMADAAVTAPRKRTFRKFSYRGVDLDALLDLSSEQLMELVPCRVRRKFSRGLNRKSMALIKKLRKAKKECPEYEKPAPVKTHLRNMIIVPEMIGSVVGVYNGKVFNQVEIKPDMVSHYLGGMLPRDALFFHGWGKRECDARAETQRMLPRICFPPPVRLCIKLCIWQ